MPDESFEYFLSKLPLAVQGPACTDTHVNTFTGLVPNALISYWQEFGFSGFGDGVIWLIDPMEWATTTEILLDGLQHPQLPPDAQFIPFARSAFGKVWFWTPGYGITLILNPADGTAFFGSLMDPSRDTDGLLTAFFATAKKDRFDFLDNSEEYMFDRVSKRLGSLQFDQVYGFAPGIVLGGPVVPENTHLFEIHAHMALLRAAIADREAFVAWLKTQDPDAPVSIKAFWSDSASTSATPKPINGGWRTY
ncbi:GAD-like domain-containing protein [Mycobacteroides chelonae]|uniref:GAD-like domain-containing protein n=1 Tax=Mycobacteroides chelonae TaxID=1774 RepID=UPI003AAEEEE5